MDKTVKRVKWVEQDVMFGTRERRMTVFSNKGWRDTKYFMRRKSFESLWRLYVAGMADSGGAKEIGTYEDYTIAQLDAEYMAEKEGGACPIP
jgi:hypothetical protein